jgi:predicted peroxiredoxin
MEMPRNDSPRFVVRIAIAFIVLSVFGLFVSRAAAQGAPKQKVVVHLTHYTDQLHAVKMAVHLAHAMQTMGAEVTLLLDLEGVRLASTKEPQSLIWGKGDPISVEYEALVKAGGRVLLCPHCAEHAGITERDLRPGAQLGREGALAKTVLAADKVLDY